MPLPDGYLSPEASEEALTRLYAAVTHPGDVVSLPAALARFDRSPGRRRAIAEVRAALGLVRDGLACARPPSLALTERGLKVVVQ